ncbi:response regulator [Parvularcula oceani]|uniref:response regulator n=1 Tax=Parvularcula oceani TaxID=1247963 RepID=UPI0004E18C97|nr:response regulator [Parvularcula oceani]
MTITTRPPLGVLRQFSRAVFADRLIGDELMRMTMARVDVDPSASSASVTDLMVSFVRSWRAVAREGRQEPALFSDAALISALPPPPDDARLMLLLVDVMGFTPAEAARIVGFEGDPAGLLQQGRAGLRLEDDPTAVIIEDEPLIAADLRAILQRIGVQVTGEARSAAEAVRTVSIARPDVIFADYNLDGRATGIDAVLEIQQDHDCPVIFITGYPDRVLQGDEIEPDFVISKPYTPNNVRAAVVHCLDARRA